MAERETRRAAREADRAERRQQRDEKRAKRAYRSRAAAGDKAAPAAGPPGEDAPRDFSFRGETYRYFRHPYNTTWLHERAVEIPVVFGLVRKYREGRVLEVGNVLSHYFPIGHEVIDKYEPGDRVINQDILDFEPPAGYDLIASISTLEHIGWDETPRDPDKVIAAVDRLRSWLAPGGRLVFTFPIGYNSDLDGFLRDGRIAGTELSCLRRISEDNRWQEVPCNDAWGAHYNEPFYCANALAVGVIERPEPAVPTTS